MQKFFFKKVWNNIIILLSDIYYRNDGCTMYEHKLSLGIKPSWRDRARNPLVGKFGKYIL